MYKIVTFDPHSNPERWKWFPFWVFVFGLFGVSWRGGFGLRKWKLKDSKKTCPGTPLGTGIQAHVQMTPKPAPLTTMLGCLIHSGSLHL